MDAIERAKEIVAASEWSGDLRANMTRVVGAGRILAKHIKEQENATCKWVVDEVAFTSNSACRERIQYGPYDWPLNRFKHCPFCGKKLEVMK